MSFTLRVTFSGLCLFVPDRVNGKMHVLMPPTSHGPGSLHDSGGGHEGHEGNADLGEHAEGGERTEGAGQAEHGGRDQTPLSGHAADPHCTDAHAARLVFDIAHLSPGNTEPKGILAHVLLEDFALDLSAPAGTVDLSLPPSIVPVGRLVGNQKIRRKLLERVPGPKVLSRVTLTTGACTDHDPGALWEVGGVETCMTFSLEWTVGDFGTEPLRLDLLNLRDAGDQEALPDLYPIGPDGDKVVDLSVYHVLEGDLPPVDIPPPPPAPGPGYRARHFAMLHKLFEVHRPFAPPVLLSRVCPDRLTDDPRVFSGQVHALSKRALNADLAKFAAANFFGSSFTCMMGQEDPGDG
jgi:hypothetical protein